MDRIKNAFGFSGASSLNTSLVEEKGVTPGTTPPDSPRKDHSPVAVINEHSSAEYHKINEEIPSFTGKDNDVKKGEKDLIGQIKNEIKLNDLREPLLGKEGFGEGKVKKYSNLSPGHTESPQEDNSGDYHLAGQTEAENKAGTGLPKPGYLPPESREN